MGPLEEGLEIAAQVLQSISHAIRTNGEAINEAPAFKDIEEIVLEGISTRMSELGREAETGQILKGLEATFAEHPSLLDRVTGAVIPPFKTEDDQLLIEQDLLRCVLKVTAGCWQGTAFAIGVKGCILTANHVVRERDGDKVTLTFDGKTGEEVSGEATVIDSNLQSDIALLKVEDERTQDRFKQAGLEPCSPEMQDVNKLCRHPVLCSGYHTDEVREGVRILSRCPAWGQVVRFDPIRTVEFRGNVTQNCLILLFSEGEETIRQGMSGGPILDLETGEVMAMITGAQAVSIHQPYSKKTENLPVAEYGFGVFLSDVADSWPEFKQYCLTGT